MLLLSLLFPGVPIVCLGAWQDPPRLVAVIVLAHSCHQKSFCFHLVCPLALGIDGSRQSNVASQRLESEGWGRELLQTTRWYIWLPPAQWRSIGTDGAQSFADPSFLLPGQCCAYLSTAAASRGTWEFCFLVPGKGDQGSFRVFANVQKRSLLLPLCCNGLSASMY